ncbi:hypothetical protein [Paracoccus sp. (in: a-proteobacteria)]|uniref:hypothetical protein n=1 Tax=Paracoccus sp. TaxID=267 RepID=UPI003A874C18
MTPLAIAQFREPGPEFRMAAFWFWHRIPAPEETRDQLADMRAKGISRVMIQARPAMPIHDYLSPAYLAAYRDAAHEAKRLGLRLTIYDEYGWMSGHGGGRTVQGADHLRERHLFWTSGHAEAERTVLRISGIRSGFLDFLGQAGRDWVYEGGVPRWTDWRIVLMAGPQARRLTCPATIVATGPQSCRIELLHGPQVAPGGALTVFAAARCATSRLINYLLPEAAARFAEQVYAPLLQAAGDAAEGFFFDHPYAGFYDWAQRHGNLQGSILWDESLLAGVPPDPADFLALTGGDGQAARRRAAFLRRYGEALHEAFFGTLSRWTRKRGLGFTGHELLTHVGGWRLAGGLSGIDPRTMPGLDHFGIDRFRTETAADCADFAPQVSARMGDSIARASGRSRCLVEQYATGRGDGAPGLAGQWGLSARVFRAQALRNLILGARQILLHAVNLTDGQPGDGLFSARFDFAPAYNHLPWWQDCPALFAEIARVSAFLDQGQPQHDIALLYPLDTILAEGPQAPCCAHFGWWAEELARAGLGYDIIDESRMPEALTPYRLLVLPAAAPACRAQATQGFAGRIVATGGDDATGQAAIRRMVAHLPRPDCDANFITGNGWTAISRVGAGWRLVAFNDRDDPARLSVTLPGPGIRGTRWDPVSGEVAPLCGPVPMVLPLAAQEILCLELAAGEAVPPVPAPKPRDLPPPIRLAQGWRLQIGDAPPRPVSVWRGWEVQGHPVFAGTGIYRCDITPPPPPEGCQWALQLPGLHEMAECWLNGEYLGRQIAVAQSFPLLCGGRLEIHVRNTAANKYYTGTGYRGDLPLPSGLTQPPRLVAVRAG